MLTRKKNQLNTINEFRGMLKSVKNIITKQIILGMDFNLYFDSLLESQGRNPILKNIYITKMIELKNTLEICNISRLSNLKTKKFTFQKSHRI